MAPGELAEGAGEYAPSHAGDVRDAVDGVAAGLAARERALWALLGLALVADIATTVAGLQLGLAEGNPVVAASLADGGLGGFLLLKATVVGLGVGARLALPRYRVAIPLGLALPWLLAAWLNATLLVGAL